jgi:uncharacterized membrane protein
MLLLLLLLLPAVAAVAARGVARDLPAHPVPARLPLQAVVAAVVVLLRR